MPSDESSLFKKLDVVKKGADLGDDSWNATRGTVPKDIVDKGGPFVVGGIMFLIHALEFRKACKKLYTALFGSTIKQAKVKATTSGLGVILTGVGIGLSVTYIVGQLSEIGVIGAVSAPTVALMPFLPVILPALLMVTYAIYLGRKSYIFHQAKKAEKSAWDEHVKSPNSGNYTTYKEEAYKNRIKQEKKVSFSVIEVLGAGLVTTGLVLGSTAVLGLLGFGAVASFGALPLALLLAGAGVGLGSKVVEYIDDKYNGKFTGGMRRFFRKCFKPFGMSANELQPEQCSVDKGVKDHKEPPAALPSPAEMKQEEEPAAALPSPPAAPLSPAASRSSTANLIINNVGSQDQSIPPHEFKNQVREHYSPLFVKEPAREVKEQVVPTYPTSRGCRYPLSA